VSELVSSFIARQVMTLAFKVDVSQVGLDEMREYPELGELDRHFVIAANGSACLWLVLLLDAQAENELIPGWASVHVSMNILLFLIKLNFR